MTKTSASAHVLEENEFRVLKLLEADRGQSNLSFGCANYLIVWLSPSANAGEVQNPAPSPKNVRGRRATNPPSLIHMSTNNPFANDEIYTMLLTHELLLHTLRTNSCGLHPEALTEGTLNTDNVHRYRCVRPCQLLQCTHSAVQYSSVHTLYTLTIW